MRFAYPSEVRILRTTGRDERGNPTATTVVDLDGWAVWPDTGSQGSEDSAASDVREERAVLAGPVGDEVPSSTDSVEVLTGPLAGVWDVMVSAQDWTSPLSGWSAGVIVRLRRRGRV